MPVLTRRNGFFYAWIFILADPEEARKYSATIHVGEGTQSGLVHRGGVVSIDVKRDDILKMRSGVVSFAQSGMGHSFFSHLKTGEKEIQVSYVIESSGMSKQLMGLGELLRMKEEGAAPSSPKRSKGASSRASGLRENGGDSENEGSISEDEQANSENHPSEDGNATSEDENANSEDEIGNSEDERILSGEEHNSSGSEDEREHANSGDEGTNSEGNRSPTPSFLPPTPGRSDEYPEYPETSMDRLWIMDRFIDEQVIP